MSGDRERMRATLVNALAKIAHKACRNGENKTREWPALRDLPGPHGWLCVGEMYADELLDLLLVAPQLSPDGIELVVKGRANVAAVVGALTAAGYRVAEKGGGDGG